MLPASTSALTFRSVVALLIIAGLAVAGYLLLDHLLSSGRRLASFVTLSDKQQMSTQRIAYFSQRLSLPGTESDHDIERTRLKEEAADLLEDEEKLIAKGANPINR